MSNRKEQRRWKSADWVEANIKMTAQFFCDWYFYFLSEPSQTNLLPKYWNDSNRDDLAETMIQVLQSLWFYQYIYQRLFCCYVCLFHEHQADQSPPEHVDIFFVRQTRVWRKWELGRLMSKPPSLLLWSFHQSTKFFWHAIAKLNPFLRFSHEQWMKILRLDHLILDLIWIYHRTFSCGLG